MLPGPFGWFSPPVWFSKTTLVTGDSFWLAASSLSTGGSSAWFACENGVLAGAGSLGKSRGAVEGLGTGGERQRAHLRLAGILARVQQVGRRRKRHETRHGRA